MNRIIKFASLQCEKKKTKPSDIQGEWKGMPALCWCFKQIPPWEHRCQLITQEEATWPHWLAICKWAWTAANKTGEHSKNFERRIVSKDKKELRGEWPWASLRKGLSSSSGRPHSKTHVEYLTWPTHKPVSSRTEQREACTAPCAVMRWLWHENVAP